MSSLLEWIISNTAVAIFLGFAATVAARFARLPALSHALWLLALVKMITPPLFQVSVPVNAFEKVETISVASHSVSGRIEEDRIENLGTNALPENRSDLQTRFSWQAMLLALWIIGSLTWFTLAGRRAFRFNGWLRKANPTSPELDDLVQSVAQRLNLSRLPRAVMFEGIASPLLWSFGGQAWIAFPAKLMDSLSSEERETLIAHELAHYRRADHWFRWLEVMLIGIYWWHPVVWWIRRGLRQAEEDCCDAWVLWAYPSSEKPYARTLLKTIDFLADDADPIPTTACGISGRGKINNVKQRFEMILNKKTNPRMTWRHATLAGVFAVILLPISGIVLDTRLQAKESNKSNSESEKVSSESTTVTDRLARLEQAIEKLIENRSSDPAPSKEAIEANYRYEHSKREMNLGRLTSELELADSEGSILLMRFEKMREKAKLEYNELKKKFDEGRIGKSDLNNSKLALDLADLDFAQSQIQFDRRMRKLRAEIKIHELELKHLEQMLSKPDVF